MRSKEKVTENIHHPLLLCFHPHFCNECLLLQLRVVQHYCQKDIREFWLPGLWRPLLVWDDTYAVFLVCVPVPFAFVVLKDGFTDSPTAVLQELKDLVATKIAKYAVPEHFLVRPRPPVTHLTCTSSTKLLYYFPMRCVLGGEAAAKDPVWKNHEADSQEGCHRDKRPWWCVNFRWPNCCQRDN